MKNRFFTLMFLLTLVAYPVHLFAQAPGKMSYQCVVRNSSGALVTNHAVGIRISILQGTATGTVVFSETYSPVPQTNANGLVTVEIGSGTASVSTFADINWSSGPYFLKTETDPTGGTAYSITGTSQLLSVPYALQSKLAEGVADNSISSVKIADNSILATDLTNNSVTTAKLSDLAVLTNKLANSAVTTEKIMNQGVTGAKIAQAGAAAGQALKWNGTIWAPANDETGGGGLTLPYAGIASSDNIAFSVSNTTTAIHGVSSTTSSYASAGVVGESASPKGHGVEGYASASSVDAYGVYGYSVGGTGVYGSGTKGVYGGTSVSNSFGVGGYNLATSGIPAFGVYGSSASEQGTGVYGVALASSMSSETYGVYGRSFAPLDGYGVYGTGRYGVYGYSDDPMGVGAYGLASNTTGENFGVVGASHSPLGKGVAGSNSSPEGSTVGVFGAVASASGYSGYFTGGRFYVKGRTGIGIDEPSSGIHIKGGGWPESFLYMQSDANEDAGMRFYEGTTARWSLFNTGGTGGLQIYNTSGVTAIFCRQSPVYVGIGTSQPTCLLQVGTTGDGSQARANAWNILSDARLKKGFAGIPDPLEMVDNLNGYYFFWNTGTDQLRQVGFVAQEVQKILPEAVSEGGDGYLSIDYGKIAPLLVEAIKTLKAENDQLKSRLERLESLLGAGIGE